MFQSNLELVVPLEIVVLLAVVVLLPVAVDDEDGIFLLGKWFSNLFSISSTFYDIFNANLLSQKSQVHCKL